MPILQKAFAISFEIKPTSIYTSSSNIIHFTTGGSCCGLGSRVPFVYFYPYTTKLYICTAINNYGNSCYYIHYDIPFNQYTKVEITQQRSHNGTQYNSTGDYRFKVNVGGQEIINVNNSIPRSFTNVKVYKASPYGSTANARIRNFLYRNLPVNEGL